MGGAIELAPLRTRIEVDLKNFKDSLSRASAEGVNAAKDMSSRMSSAVKVGDTLEKAGSKMTRAITVPLAGAGGACTKFYLDAEQSFSKVGTIIDKQKVPVDKLKDSVKKASNETGVAVTDFNEALYQSISAGVDSGKAVQFTTDMVKLAKGGFTDTSSAVDVVTTALNAYGMGADQATSVSDKLITTQNLGKTTVDELASSMGKVIPTANAYGVNLDNVCAVMADLTKNGISTSEATTYFNSMLNELGKSGTKASDVLKEKTGKSFAELQAAGVPLTDCLKILKDSAEESGVSLTDMFGSSEAAKAALTIMKDDGVEYNSILKDMEKSAGATQKAYDEMNEAPLEKIKKALIQLENAAIDLGGALAPTVEKVASFIGKLAEKFSSLPKPVQEFIAKAGLLALALGPLTSTVGKVIKIATKLSGAFKLIKTGASLIGPALSLLTGPFGGAALAIGGVVGAGVALYKNWDTIKEKAGQLKDKVVGKFEELKNGASEKWESIKTTISEKAKGMKNAVVEKASNLKEGFHSRCEEIRAGVSEKFTQIKDTTTNLMETAKENVKGKLANMKQTYSDAGGGIKGIVAVAMQGVKDHFGNYMDLANRLTGGKLSEIKDAFTGKLNGAKDAVSGILNGIKDKFGSIMDGSKNVVRNAIDKIKGFFNFKWSLPKIKVPHFSISFDKGGLLGKAAQKLGLPGIPNIDVKWNAKGAILTNPTIFGMAGNTLLGGGEAGNEAVLPLEPFYKRLSKMMDDRLGREPASERAEDLSGIPSVLEAHLYFSGRSVETVFAPLVNKGLGRQAVLERRR